MHCVYVLQSQKDKKYYVGYTDNLKRRLLEHNAGKTRSLKNRLPMKLVYWESALDKHQAYIREKQIKSYRGGVAFQKLIDKFVGSPPPDSI